ncbi:polcalcin Aln g 4-like [Juglans microcarpa x Juglans regia]|uniref:polcalcin Aln g 4-like n=1 Tax=Juglans microcarpa x Juglans regia TaxID=2249226 RepID=UPI001B7E7411|nr:polcalcin Aln g 4-like [Juglans microcarpa x Juglans regia]
MEDDLPLWKTISLSTQVLAPQPLGSLIRGKHKDFSVIVITTTKTMADADDPQDQAERERIFKCFDANGDGKISAAELGDALQTLGRVTADEVKHMMDEIDTDGDGFISFQEFIAFALENRGLMKDVAKIFY